MSFKFFNPVRANFGAGALGALDALIGDRNALLVSSKGAKARGWLRNINKITGKISRLIDNCEENPSFHFLKEAYKEARPDEAKSFDVIVALGGGSVIDTAKFLSVQEAGAMANFDFVEELARGGRQKKD